MNRRNLALVLVVVGFIIYFYPQFQQFASEGSQLTGVVFAVGGVLLWFMPSTDTKRKKK